MSNHAEPPATAGGSSAFGAGPVPLVGLAHGSRHRRGAEAIERLMAAVGEQGGVPTRAAYLDLAQPDLGTVARELAAAGHRRAVVVPLLFTNAFHATVDVPEAVAEARAETGLELVVADIVGTADDVADVLEGVLAAHGASAAASALLYAVGSSNPAANEAVADLAARLAVRRGTPVGVAFGTCAPRVDAVLDGLPAPVALWPLFLSDGLLLDPLRRLGAERGWPMTEPLGDAAAPLVLHRYAAALGLSDGERLPRRDVGVLG